MKTKRELSQVAQCAKQIRAILKKEFPNIKFTVTSQNYSMGDNVNVRYTDGVPESVVNEKIKHFQYGQFDGMTDYYDSNNYIDGLPQTKYLFVNRTISQCHYDEARKQIMQDFHLEEFNDTIAFEIFHEWENMVLFKRIKDLTF